VERLVVSEFRRGHARVGRDRAQNGALAAGVAEALDTLGDDVEGGQPRGDPAVEVAGRGVRLIVSPNQMPSKPMRSISCERAMTSAADRAEPSGFSCGKANDA
jgi:hypothetical protein